MIIYIAGPYSANTKEEVISNIARARIVAHDLWEAGYPTICPHMNTAEFDDINKSIFYAGDLEILEKCDAVVLLPHWKTSMGARMEVQHAIKHGIRIYKNVGEFLRLMGRAMYA